MGFHHTADAAHFLDRVRPTLMLDEARNSTGLGIAMNCARGIRYGDDSPCFFWMESEAGDIDVVGFWTPPFPLSVVIGEPARMPALAMALPEGFAARVREVNGPSASSTALAEALFRQENPSPAAAPPTRKMELALFELDRVQQPPISEGMMRIAGPPDTELAREWCHAFAVEAGLTNGSDGPSQRVPVLEEGRLVLWEVEGLPVAMAASARETPHGMCINSVYTPPDFRGRGYASSIVSALTSHWLAKGKSFCFLFTDLANPTSNSIYPKIGYREIERFTLMDLQRP